MQINVAQAGQAQSRKKLSNEGGPQLLLRNTNFGHLSCETKSVRLAFD